jgi:hypothetical protein
MKPRKLPHRRQNSGKSMKITAAVLAPVLAVGLGIAALSVVTGEEKPDSDYCYKREQHKTAIFIDNSLRGLSESQLRDYRTGFSRAYEASPPNAKIMVFTTAAGSNGSLANPVFSICKPAATPEEQAAIGAPEKPAPYLKRHAGEAAARYAQAVDVVLRETQDNKELAGDSPILEQLRAISFHAGFAGTSRSLTVITDGIQNSELGRFCTEKDAMPPFDRFKKRSDYELNIKPRSFAGTEITLLLAEFGELPAPQLPYCGNNEIRSWWPAYFRDNGSKSVETTRLRYWAEVK